MNTQCKNDCFMGYGLLDEFATNFHHEPESLEYYKEMVEKLKLSSPVEEPDRLPEDSVCVN